MTPAAKRLERAVSWNRKVWDLRRVVDDVQAQIRELDAAVRQEVREARNEVLQEESQPQAMAGSQP